ncbi:Serine/threonine-protein kinase [Coniosporium apollinis]|uniref:non-specific serine/threonine protein kinase n=1 Tax=Coniosporium apollinis TaxID=61459 RepID=A0ABQ9P7Q7_9PEZI|nr:Serine/threonine-protein kinase [Coniosporium apollinis]
MKLDRYVNALLEERRELAQIPNALAYHRILETPTNGYLIRQYIHSSLYDRMSTRPFLEDIEKRWLAFQLLCAVRDCHARNIYHGDIKTENILVTSWNWLYLADFSSSFKPIYLPEDNPADFSFYFDASGRRTCYVAPERFLGTGSLNEGTGKLTWAMDIFSVGCVIAEIFLETPIFNYSQLFRYRAGEYEPQHVHLNKIEDKGVRELVQHMIQLEPESRYSAEEYLNFWRQKTFPDYFFNFLHQYMYTITDPSSGHGPIGSEKFEESDNRIDKIYYDFDKITYFLDNDADSESIKPRESTPKKWNDVFPLHIDIPNYQHQASTTMSRTVDDGTLIFLTVVVAALRTTARAKARLRACELMLAFAERCTDEAKLDRILPYLVSLLNDKSDMVKVTALRIMTQLIDLVSVVSPTNVYLFRDYLLLQLPFGNEAFMKPSQLVRAAYASCLAPLATTASRFLDMMQALRADGSLPSSGSEGEENGSGHHTFRELFDSARVDLLRHFEVPTKALLTDRESAVKRAFLGSVSNLCVFFGNPRANDVILSHLNTYLNDKDWMLKCAFFETIVGVATYVGGASLEEFILPLMVQALTDPEEFVVERVLTSLASIAQLGLFQRSKTWELVDVIGRFTVHPNIWIREAAAQFVSSATTYLSTADNHSIIIPLVKPYLKVLPTDFSEIKLLDSLKKPLPRPVLDLASSWALQSESGLFWKPAQQQRTFSFSSADEAVPTVSARDLGPKSLSRIPKNDDDEKWLARLRSIGMTADDEFKLIALREYIWKSARRKKMEESTPTPPIFNDIVKLKDLGINPQIVFFDHNVGLLSPNGQMQHAETKPHTIADALLEASTTADDTNARHRVSQTNGHKTRLNSNGSAALDPPSLPTSPGQLEGVLFPSSKSSPHWQSLQVPNRTSKDTAHDGLPSSLESDGNLSLGSHNHPIRNKSSAINLISRNQPPSKAEAETSTTSATAFGKVDGLQPRDGTLQRKPSPLALAQQQHRSLPKEGKFQAVHTYTGHDPSVLKLLDSFYLENYPADYVEFGPPVTPLSGRQPIKRSSGLNSSIPWRPEGNLVATMGEHTGAINRVVVAPDHAFFITGSDDGSVKVWDTGRLERNVAHRSRATYKHAAGVAVTALTFIENTHCFISTGSDGSVHVVKVDYSEGNEARGPRFGKPVMLREYHLREGQHAVWAEHFKSDSQSILVLATNNSRVVAIELRTMTELYELNNPLHHGTPTCFCIDRKHHWLLLGTTHGVLDLWDLRFRLRLKGWAFSGASPIHRIRMQTLKGSHKRVCIAGGTGQGEVTVWDIEKTVCKAIYRIKDCKDTSKGHNLIDVDEERPGGMLSRFATRNLEPSSSGTDRGIRALALGTHVPEDGSEPRHFFMLTAGPDWKVRYWDTNRDRVESSMVVSGLGLEEPKPVYRAKPTATETIIVQEMTPEQVAAEAEGEQGGKKSASGRTAEGRSGSSNSSGKRDAGKKPSRSSLMSLQQQMLLKSHLDTITDVALLEHPYGMVVSVDRSGVIYVFQ